MSNQTDDRGPRVNEAIRIKEVRVITEEGKQLGVIPTREALRLASEAGLDLVEVQPHLKPPVCKIMDYGKFKYQQKRHAAEQKKKQKTFEVKQMQFGPNIEQHDYETKLNHIKGFLGDGNKCLVSVYFQGREIAHTDLGQELLKRIAEDLKELATVEGQIKMEGRDMSMTLAPGKKPNV